MSVTKPANITFGAEEAPPLLVTLVSAVQHVGVVAIFIIYPLIVSRAAGVSAEEISNIIRMGMLVLAIAVLLQALPKGPVGSRFLAPSIFTGVYLAPSLIAVKMGGMPLVWGMTIFAGVIEIVLSRLWPRLRTFIPPESAGLVVFLVGLIIGLAALRLLMGEKPAGALVPEEGLVCAASLAVMIALNIWSKGRLRLFCILIGMIAGYAVAAATGLLTARDLQTVLEQPLVALPTARFLSWSFDNSLILPFAVTALAAAMSATAVITTYQRITDADWVRPNTESIRGGILGDGIAAAVAGLFGTYGLTISTANVGLVAATGVASRRIGFWIAGLLAIAAIQPTLAGTLVIMPQPVMAAAMLFTAVFIMISGVQIITSRILDARRTLVVGMGVMTFVGVSVYPAAFAPAPQWVQPIVSSPLVLATLVALALNLIFRLGVRRVVEMPIAPTGLNYKEVHDFIERNAAVWGARRDVVDRVDFAVQQAIETIANFCGVEGSINFKIGYDEFDIDVSLSYRGAPLELFDALPTQEEILESEHGVQRLAGYLIKRRSDNIQVRSSEDKVTISMHFKH